MAAGSCLIIFEKMTDVAVALIFSKFVILTLFWHSLAYSVIISFVSFSLFRWNDECILFKSREEKARERVGVR